MVHLELPWPPSVNHYYRHVGPRTLISRAGRRYREEVRRIMAPMCLRPAKGRLAVSIEAYPPDRRKRDVDNLQKALIDSVQHGGAYVDDSQIVWLLTIKAEVVPGGKVVVSIRELSDGQKLPAAEAFWSDN